MDVTNDEHIAELMKVCKEKLGGLDFLLHSIAFALPDDLKRDTIETSRAGFKLAMEISAYSLIALANACARISSIRGASILTLTYYGGERPVPGYNVMGICKAALDSIVKYLAYDLGPRGVRVNALSPGPLQTISGRGAGVDEMLGLYEAMAPLGRNVTHEEAGKCGAFLALRHVVRRSPAKSCTSTAATTSWARPGGCWTQIKAAQEFVMAVVASIAVATCPRIA